MPHISTGNRCPFDHLEPGPLPDLTTYEQALGFGRQSIASEVRRVRAGEEPETDSLRLELAAHLAVLIGEVWERVGDWIARHPDSTGLGTLGDQKVLSFLSSPQELDGPLRGPILRALNEVEIGDLRTLKSASELAALVEMLERYTRLPS